MSNDSHIVTVTVTVGPEESFKNAKDVLGALSGSWIAVHNSDALGELRKLKTNCKAVIHSLETNKTVIPNEAVDALVAIKRLLN